MRILLKDSKRKQQKSDYQATHATVNNMIRYLGMIPSLVMDAGCTFYNPLAGLRRLRLKSLRIWVVDR